MPQDDSQIDSESNDGNINDQSPDNAVTDDPKTEDDVTNGETIPNHQDTDESSEEIDYIALAKKGRKEHYKDDVQYMERLRIEARRKYLVDREDMQVELQKRTIEDAELTLKQGVLDGRSLELLELDKTSLKLATEAKRAREEDVHDGYLLPEAYDEKEIEKLEIMKQGTKKNEEEEYDGEYHKWENLQIQHASSQYLLSSDVKMRQLVEGADRDGANKYSLIDEKGGQIEFEAVFANRGFMTLEEQENKILENLTADERAEYLMKKRQGERQALELDRKILPVYKYREDLLAAIAAYPVLIVVGETGSGKTTQIPQYLYESGYGADKMIGVTQPRRVAAMSVAARVAQEMGVKLGNEVGYQIRFESKVTERTKIKYMTDGMLLREFLSEADLAAYSVIMIDEAHERTLHTDVAFGLVKDLSRFRPDFRLLICSATLDAEKFSSYFDDAPIFKIPGRKHQVDHYYTKAPEANYIDACVVTVMQLHIGQPLDGDILVFLPGQQEIEEVMLGLQERMDTLKRENSDVHDLKILPCYSSLPADMQQQIFEPTPKGSRKVILATNIAETSVTIDNIVYVVDPGYVKQTAYNPRTGMESLTTVPTSKASSNQRSGRAGRVKPGKCFRLFTQWSFDQEMEDSNPPEILRTDMGSVVLMLKSLGIDDLVNFDFMDSPPAQTLLASIELLYALQALNEEGELTRLGRRMADLPIDPCQSKMLLGGGVKYNVVEEVLTISSMLNVSSSVFYHPKDKELAARNMITGFYHPAGDHLTMLNVYNRWVESYYSKMWCFEHFIQDRAMQRARDIRQQLIDMMEHVEVEVTSDKNNDVAIRKAITSGFFKNTAKLNKSGKYTTIKHPHSVDLHPSSCLFRAGEEADKDNKRDQQMQALKKKKSAIRPPVVLFSELVFTTAEYMRSVIQIEPMWLMELASHYFNISEIQPQTKKSRRKDKER